MKIYAGDKACVFIKDLMYKLMKNFGKTKAPIVLITMIFLQACGQPENTGFSTENPGSANYTVIEVKDFEITGDGINENWAKTKWLNIPQRASPGEALITKAKILYSKTGIYVLFNCQDKKLTAAMHADFMDLWKEDVVEVFIWTNEEFPVYFEYEISPLDYELPIIVSNLNGDLVRWQPFHYDADRKTRHATAVQGGKKESSAFVSEWIAEFFIPYKLLRPLSNISPKHGTRWRGNLYRVDYDKEEVEWSWQLTGKSFHEYKKFGTFLFE